MAFYPIVRQNENITAAKSNRQLPRFYMQDFSILGFRVSDCRLAEQILEQHSFSLVRTNDGTEVSVAGASRVQDVVHLLQDNGLTCELADLAEGMYQG